MVSFSNIKAKHFYLYDKLAEGIMPSIKDVRDLIKISLKYSKNLFFVEEREDLRNFLRFWGSYISSQGNNFPDIDIDTSARQPKIFLAKVGSYTDIQLVALAQNGDLSAFEEIVKKYQREICGLACRMVSDPEEAKDLAQQTFMQAFIHIQSFRQDAQFRTWLFRTAINQCYNFLKGRKKDGHPIDFDFEEELVWEEDSPEQKLVSQDELRRLYAALEKLPPKLKAVLTLKVEQNLSFQEISQIIGGTPEIAEIIYKQALKNLKKNISYGAVDKEDADILPFPKIECAHNEKEIVDSIMKKICGQKY